VQQYILALSCAIVASVVAEDTMTSIEGAITVVSKPDDCEKQVVAGDMVSMHYTGTIDASSPVGEAGKEFDSSRGRGTPFDFQIGMGQVIKGWDQGVMGMCIGEKRDLVIPAALGYGDSGAGDDIPGGATLHFEVECMGISEGKEPENLFKTIDADESGDLTGEEVNAWFKKEQGMDMPAELMEKEDKDGDGIIQWEEFSGPKGPAKDEL